MAGIGQMRSKAVFKKNTPVETDSGGEVDDYATLLITYGELKRLSGGGRTLEAGQIVLNSTHTFRCRINSTLQANLNKDIKIEIGDRTFTIDSYESDDQKNFYYTFRLTAKNG